jgi:hypothetical protein
VGVPQLRDMRSLSPNPLDYLFRDNLAATLWPPFFLTIRTGKPTI